MPFGEGAHLFDREFYSAGEALQEIRKTFPYLRTEAASDTAERHLIEVDGRKTTIGFITPISREFCSKCDRLRLDSFGRIYPCLRAAIGTGLRGLPPDELKERILQTLENKKAPRASWPARPMVQLGG
jgi:cyclic pyranopterin phosphate synthase